MKPTFLIALIPAATVAVFSASFATAQTASLQDIVRNVAPTPAATIYVAREVVTMNPDNPSAEAIAVIGKRIAAVGSLTEMQELAADQDYRIDRSFADKVIMPGFVEQHVHPVLTALTMTQTVIAIEDWETTTGFSKAVRDEAEYQKRLKAALAAHTDKDKTFVSWGYHHYFLGKMSRAMLDELAPDFPVIIWHRSCHEVYMNTKAMEEYGIDAEYIGTFSASAQKQLDLEKGHLWEQGLLSAIDRLAPALASRELMLEGLAFSEEYYLRQGITTAAEPGGFYSPALQDIVNSVYKDDATPFNHYFIPDGKTLASLFLKQDGAEKMIAKTRETLTWGAGRARFLPQQVKLFSDGAIYSQLMQMKDGYTDGHSGEWMMDPDLFSMAFQAYWDAGYQINIHNNGDGGMDLVLDNLELAQRRNPRFDHRTTIVHFGFATTEQVNKAGELGAIISANPYYVTALAGRYAEFGIGPERSARMVPLGDALRANISISFHSDMPMAPAQPLKLAWSAVNRLTAEGDVVGPDQRVDIYNAMKAITINAAYSLRLEDEIGSIEAGKLANFTILEQSPFAVDPLKLQDIAVWGTALEGRIQQASTSPVEKAGLELPEMPLMRAEIEGQMTTLSGAELNLAISRCVADGICTDTNSGRGEMRLAIAAQIAKVVVPD